MFDNLISLDDARRLAEKVRQGYARRLLGAFSRTDARTAAAWRHTGHPPKHWGSIPAVRRRWNRLVTGDADLEPAAYVAQTYLAGRAPLAGLAVGCGTGANERRWAATGAFARIDAYDLSAPRIAAARRAAAEAGLGAVLHFEAADVRSLALPRHGYDVLLAENALHHFTPLEPVLDRLAAALRPGGLVVVRDFVGPARFQWTDRQLEAVAGLLRVLPAAYRQRWRSGTVKTRHFRPGRLAMRLSDPSEAAESDRIRPLLRARFRPVEERPFGGTVLHLLFDDIAHHFLDDTAETRRWLDLCFAAEDALLASGELPSDFVFAVYRKPAGG